MVRECFDFAVTPPLVWECGLLVLELVSVNTAPLGYQSHSSIDRVIDTEYRDAEGMAGSFVTLPPRTIGAMYLSAVYAFSNPATRKFGYPIL